jgi:hypothetical protein
MDKLQVLAEMAYGDDVRVRRSRGNVYVTSFTLGEVLVVRAKDPGAAERMAEAALAAAVR